MRLPVADAPVHHHFAPLQRRWMDELLGGEPPPETEATCADCAMLPTPGEARTATHYNARTKCCTYLPMLHNFLLGRILGDGALDEAGEKGRATVEARLDSGEGLTPLGLYAPAEYLERYDPGVKFGHDLSLRCPHYLEAEGGLCGVWKHRESTCSTWFCRHSTGEQGRALWREGIGPLLRETELRLADWCARQLGASASTWGPWEDKPRALFARSAELVETLGWRDLERLGGAEIASMARKTRALFDAIGG